MLKRFLLALVFASVCTTTSFAQHYFNTLGLRVNSSTPNDLSAVIGGETADDFMLGATADITGVQWRGLYVPDALSGGDRFVASADDDFEIRIYSDADGEPGPIVATFEVGNNVNRISGPIENVGLGGLASQTFEYSADIHFTAVACTTYWISILNNTANDPDNFDQLVVATGGNAFGDLNPNDGIFRSQGSITDFELVIYLILGDLNSDGRVNFLDITPFITILASGGFDFPADINEDGFVNFLDVSPFIALLNCP